MTQKNINLRLFIIVGLFVGGGGGGGTFVLDPNIINIRYLLQLFLICFVIH